MRVAVLLMFIATSASAHDFVGHGIFQDFDVKSFKPGQWVEQEFTSKFTDEDGKLITEHRFSRLSCIRTEEELVWMEETRWEVTRPDDRTVTQYQLRRKDGEVLKAWRGKAGGEGEPLSIGMSIPVRELHSGAAKRVGKVTTGRLEVSGTAMEIRKIHIEIVEPGDGEKKYSHVYCISGSVPFPVRWDDKDVLTRRTEGTVLDHPVDGPAGVVSIERTWPKGSSKFAVVAMGNDAKPTLKTK